MTGLLVVLPVILTETADLCVDSLLREGNAAEIDPADILIVDNTREGLDGRYPLRIYRDPDGHNLGVARSWNIGAREVIERDLDYLVCMSASMLFGPLMHTSWTRQMQTFWGAKVIEADGHSWHLIALHRSCFDKVGLFDENLYPAYFEAEDWCYRMRMVGWEQGFIRVWVNALSQGVALHNQIVSCPAAPLLDYMARKWGGPKGSETFVLPFGNRPLGWFKDEPIPVLAKRYGLSTWW